MPIPIEQRKDLLEINADLNLMLSYRKVILEKMPRMWVLIHRNSKTNNYGLEVNNSWGGQCSPKELEDIKEILNSNKNIEVPVVTKKTRKRKVVS